MLREISASIREVMDCDVVHISAREKGLANSAIYALDFPEGKGLIKEELLITPVGAGRRALETLKPIDQEHRTTSTSFLPIIMNCWSRKA